MAGSFELPSRRLPRRIKAAIRAMARGGGRFRPPGGVEQGPPLPEERTALDRALAPWRRRLRYRRLIVGIAGGAVAAAALAALVGLAARLTPLAAAPALALGLAALAIAAGTVHGLSGAPSPYQAARRVDRVLGLADRLPTAWEATGSGWPLARPLAADALAALAGHHPTLNLPLPLPRRALTALAAITAAMLLVWALPNPMDDVLRRRAEARARLAEATEQVDEAARLAAAAPALSPEERRAVEQVLEALQRDLARARDDREALVALSTAEEDLRVLDDPRAREQATALDRLARALAGVPLTAALGEAVGRGDAAAAQQALAALGQSLERLDPGERRQLAQALQDAANEVARGAAGQSALSGPLRAAARAVASGDAAGAEALAGMAGELADAQGGQARYEQRGRISAALRGARDAVAGTATGQPAGAGEGGGQASGQAAGEGQGQSSGQGAGQGQGQQAGSGAGGSPGQGAASGGQTGAGGGRGGSMGGTAPGGDPLGAEAGRLPGADELVFVPGAGSAGPSQQTPFETSPAPGTFRSYREVFGQYAQTARDYLDRGAIPPALRETVRQYFADLEGK